MASRLKGTMLAAMVGVIAAHCGGHGTGHGDGHDAGDGGLPEAPRGGLDVTGDALFVALGTAGSVAVIDVGVWSLAGTLRLSDTYFPHHLSLSPDRTRVAVAAPASDLSGGHGDGGHGSGGGALYILDSRTGDVVAQSTAGGTAHNLGYLPGGGTVVFALAEHDMLHFADARDLVVTAFVDVGSAPLEATPTPSGDKILVANSGAGTISVVDVAGRTVASTLPVGAQPIGAWMGTDGRAYVTSESDKKLSAIDLTSLTLVKTVDLPGTPGQTITAANGNEVWVAMEDTGKILILGQGDLLPVTEIAVATRPHGLAMSPNGASIYITDETAGEVIEVDVGTRTILRRLAVGGAPNGILYRPAL
jgi:YVTN family beta-propeller protein